jgi:hypothetical protein
MVIAVAFLQRLDLHKIRSPSRVGKGLGVRQEESWRHYPTRRKSF